MSVSYGGDSITFADGSVQSGGWTGMRNRIINGAMMIDQRNGGTSVTANNDVFGVDRFQIVASQTSKLTTQQNAGSVTPPTGFKNYLGITSTSAYTVGASEIFTKRQIIEGLNVADLGWGTASAATVTLSFWVRSSLTGTFGGAFNNTDATRNYPFTYTINSANTWEYETITIPGDTSGTWLTTNGRGMQIHFGLGVGSTLSGTAGSWSGSSYYSATGATSVVGTNGATFYITGVQLERGSTASSFEYRPYGTELALCQRYYTKTYRDDAVPGTTTSGQANSIWNSVPATNSYPQIGQWFYPVTMRAAPTIVIYNPNSGTVSGFIGDSTNFSPAVTNTVGNKCVSFYGQGVSVGTSVFISVHATANAEL